MTIYSNGQTESVSPRLCSSHFSLLLRKHNLPHIRFHELRHSCASLLLNSGYTLKDVQEYMGHADIQMTANIYGHLDHKRKMQLSKQCLNAFSNCVRKSVRTPLKEPQ